MKKSWTMLLGLMAGVFVACTPAPAKGVLSVTISGLPTGVDAAVTATSSTGATLSFTKTNSLDADIGTYTITAADVSSSGSTYIGTVTGSPATVTETTPGSASVSYALKSTAGAVTPAKTFTAPIGVGSLAFLTSAGTGQGRLYASGNANSATDPSGRLYLDTTDLSGTGGVVSASQVATAQGLAEIAFNKTTGSLYELIRATNAGATLITRYTRATAVSNLFTPLDFVITNGGFTYTPPAGTPISDYSLLAPTDTAVDNSGNLWVVDPNSTARSKIDGISATPGRLICYSAADQAAVPAAPNNRIGTPGVVYYGAAVAGAQTLVFDASGNLWVGAGTGATARLIHINIATLGTGQTPAGACPNLDTTSGNPSNREIKIPTSAVDRNLTGTSLVGPVDLVISGSNLLVAQSNNILTIPTTATTLPTTTPTTIVGLSGNITSLAVDTSNKTWVGTAGASGTGTPGRIYQLQ